MLLFTIQILVKIIHFLNLKVIAAATLGRKYRKSIIKIKQTVFRVDEYLINKEILSVFSIFASSGVFNAIKVLG